MSAAASAGDLLPSFATGHPSDDLVAAQAASLSRLPGVGTRVSLPRPNNFVLMMVPGSSSADEHLDRFVDMTAPLNLADMELLHRCERLVSSDRVPEARTEALRDVLADWRANFEAGSNLVGCLHAGRFASLISDVQPIASLVATEWADVGDAFLTVDPIFHELVRVNVYLPPGIVEHVLRVVLEIDADTGLLDAVDRIEVAKRFDERVDWVVPGHPTLIFYVGASADGNSSAADLASLLRSIGATLGTTRMPPPPAASLHEYAVACHANVNVTQGFRLYKRYLAMLGLIDVVYDGACGHALVNESRATLPISRALRTLIDRNG